MTMIFFHYPSRNSSRPGSDVIVAQSIRTSEHIGDIPHILYCLYGGCDYVCVCDTMNRRNNTHETTYNDDSGM